MTKPTIDPGIYGLSQTYWEGLTLIERALYEDIRPLAKHDSSVSIMLHRLQQNLDMYCDMAVQQGGVFDLNPEFQRGHVWSLAKQVAFMEALFRGIAPLLFRFNSPSFGERSSEKGDIARGDFVCIDGLQRITAILAFQAGEFEIFNGRTIRDFTSGPFMMARFHATFEVYSFCWRRDLLQFYRDLNAGGVVHSEEEIAKIDAMIAAEDKKRGKRDA